MLVFGAYCAGLCLVKGLNQTNMDNRYAFGLWIFVDLTIIALGAGAFFPGFCSTSSNSRTQGGDPTARSSSA
jgi:molybdopterin-containing oxidoreductase family membrane subunit